MVSTRLVLSDSTWRVENKEEKIKKKKKENNSQNSALVYTGHYTSAVFFPLFHMKSSQRTKRELEFGGPTEFKNNKTYLCTAFKISYLHMQICAQEKHLIRSGKQ